MIPPTRWNGPLARRRTTVRVAACAALGVLGSTVTGGCLLTLFLAHLSFFGERPHVPLRDTLLLLTGAAAGISVPAVAMALVLDGRYQRLMVVAIMLAALVLGALCVVLVMAA